MTQNETVVLTRDVDIVTIPEGMSGHLPKGEQVTIYQALGSNYTVITAYGHMVRVAGNDADALGKEKLETANLSDEINQDAVEKNCWQAMKTVFDPEIPVNIVDLGLVYECRVDQVDEALYDAHIKMTLTAPGCGMGPVLQSDVEKCIKALPGIDQVTIEIVLDPPWSREMMSEVAQLQLGLY